MNFFFLTDEEQSSSRSPAPKAAIVLVAHPPSILSSSLARRPARSLRCRCFSALIIDGGGDDKTCARAEADPLTSYSHCCASGRECHTIDRDGRRRFRLKRQSVDSERRRQESTLLETGRDGCLNSPPRGVVRICRAPEIVTGVPRGRTLEPSSIRNPEGFAVNVVASDVDHICRGRLIWLSRLMLAPPIWSTPHGLSESVVPDTTTAEPPGKTSDPATVKSRWVGCKCRTVDVESIGSGNRTRQIDCRATDDHVPPLCRAILGVPEM